MARKNRYTPPGFTYHVVNRGNDRRAIFLEHCDYAAFLQRLAQSGHRFPVNVYGYCLMPNHFHLLVEPLEDNALSACLQWLTCRYACEFRKKTKTVGHGHVFQRRFWSAAARDERAFLEYLRYIEANPVRAQLVSKADLWPWSSFADREGCGRRILRPCPVEVPAQWAALVNCVQTAEALDRIREALVPSPGRPSRKDRLQ
jgi:putative transposase